MSYCVGEAGQRAGDPSEAPLALLAPGKEEESEEPVKSLLEVSHALKTSFREVHPQVIDLLNVPANGNSRGLNVNIAYSEK